MFPDAPLKALTGGVVEALRVESIPILLDALCEEARRVFPVPPGATFTEEFTLLTRALANVLDWFSAMGFSAEGMLDTRSLDGSPAGMAIAFARLVLEIASVCKTHGVPLGEAVGQVLDFERQWRRSHQNEPSPATIDFRKLHEGSEGSEPDDIDWDDCESLRDFLTLVDIEVSTETVKGWSIEQRKQANDWAGAVHLRASDNCDVPQPPKPSFLPPEGDYTTPGALFHVLAQTDFPIDPRAILTWTEEERIEAYEWAVGANPIPQTAPKHVLRAWGLTPQVEE